MIANHHWNASHFSLIVEAKGYPTFTAGQFTRLALPIDGFEIARSYSFVNPPHAAHCEFYLSVIQGGELTPHLHGLQPGDPLLLSNKPNGFLVLDELPPGRDLWLVATGTGIGPYLSILRTSEPWQRFENIVLVHGVRQQSDLVYRDMLNNLAEEHPGQFQWLAFVSRERAPGCFNGRIPAAIDNGQLEAAAGLPISAEHSQFMLCGNPQMIIDASESLKARGLSKNLRRAPGQITVERYWT